MFSSQKKLHNIQDLFNEIKDYIELQKKFVQLDLVTKLTILCSALITTLIIGVLGIVVFSYLSLMFATYLASVLENEILAYFIIAFTFLLIALVVYVKRKQLITQPIANFIGKLFLNKK